MVSLMRCRGMLNSERRRLHSCFGSSSWDLVAVSSVLVLSSSCWQPSCSCLVLASSALPLAQLFSSSFLARAVWSSWLRS